jgi:hypothetical protein
MKVERDGELRGVLIFIRLHFGRNRFVDTWKSQTSWSTPYIRLKTATPVRRGDLIEVTVRTDITENPRYSMNVARLEDGSRADLGGYEWMGD